MDTPEPSGTPTLEDVAREAGVSTSTASRVLNGSTRRVAEAYRERVRAAAERLGYTTNLSAQAVAKGSSATVALLVADIGDPYFAQIAAGVARVAEAAGLIVTVAITGRDSRRELHLVRTLRGHRPRALILAASRLESDPVEPELRTELAAYAASGGRLALVGRNELGYNTVRTDDREAGRSLAEHVVGLGYRRFAAIVGPLLVRTSTDRLHGLRDGLAGHGIELPERRTIVSEFSRAGGYAGAHRLVSRGLDGTDCLFAISDAMAMGAMSALRDAGITPGEDIGVCGFDDIPTVRDVVPRLTTVRIPVEELGELALKAALGDGSPAEHRIGTEVVGRDSTPGR